MFLIQIKTKNLKKWTTYTDYYEDLPRLRIMTEVLRGNQNVTGVRILQSKVIETHERKSTSYSLAE